MSDIRTSLKNISWLYSINASFKARHQERRLRQIARSYEARARRDGIVYDEQHALALVQERLHERTIVSSMSLSSAAPAQPSQQKPRVFWIGADHDQDASGFLQALQRQAEVIIFHSEDGSYGPISSQPLDRRPAVPEVVTRNSAWLLKQVKEEHAKAPIQLLLGQMWANNLEVTALQEIQKLGIITVNIAMDDKLADLWESYRGRRMGSVGLAAGLDLVLTNSFDACLWYAVEGCPAVYWPLGSDPDIFYPRPPKTHDVVFVGNNYGIRRMLVRRLQQAGVSVDTYGSGWPNGYAPNIAKVFGSARIILGTNNVGYSQKIRSIKLRDFDATMSGALYLTQRNADLARLFTEDREIACYDSIDECIEKAKFYLEHTEKREAVAAAGLAKARAQFTWDKRVADALRFVALVA